MRVQASGLTVDIGGLENKQETTIMGYIVVIWGLWGSVRFRVEGLGFRELGS